MGKKLIIPGADFSQNAILLNEIVFKVKAPNGSVQMSYRGTDNTYHVYGTYTSENSDKIYSVQVDNYVGVTGYNSPYQMFKDQTDLKECSIYDLNGVLNSLYNTFNGCTALEKVRLKSPAKISPLSLTFSGCTSLTEIVGIETLDVSKSNNFMNVFMGTKIQHLSLNGWDMSYCNTITKFVKIFYGMTELVTLDLSNTVLNATIAADVYSSGHGGSSGNHFSSDMTKLTKIYVDNVSADDIAYWLSWVNQIGHGYTFTQQTVTEGDIERQALVRNV